MYSLISLLLKTQICYREATLYLRVFWYSTTGFSVYSKVGGRTEEDDDGDLHFTLTLEKQYEKYSNSADPTYTPSHDLPNPCHNIII